MTLHDANNEELIKKNKKRKPLGTIHLTLQMNPMTKEEMNEVGKFEFEFAGDGSLKSLPCFF